jgi:hypothetical protein
MSNRLDEANTLGVPYANLKSSSGTILKPTSDSVLYAVMEKGGTPLPNGQLLVDLTVPSGIIPRDPMFVFHLD